jgi:short-chain Z-isoprenyl diphosphate synthase
LAVGYGGRHEITEAVRDIIREHEAAGRGIDSLADDMTLDNISGHLYTAGQPDLDLVIRTSGEQRISDFMLWQTAHSELYFVEALGPDLREIDLLRALRDFARRQRRFGA